MSKQNLEYYMELLGEEKQKTGSFNLWAKQGNRYHNLATLFYKDPMCGTQWTVDEIGRAVSYDEQEIKDELENPLRRIQQIRGEEFVAMRDKSPEEVAKYLAELCNKSQVEGIEYLLEKCNEN